MEQFFKDPRTAERFRSGPLGQHMQLVSNDLFKDGYTRRSIRYHLRIIDHFGHWLKKRGETTEDITNVTSAATSVSVAVSEMGTQGH